ncbi:MAG: lamin tail domain-containing protein [Sedimentisphaerales bacterium]|nr:lamin tail domain-containing protein [Sedimentisphaerales bacterium]
MAYLTRITLILHALALMHVVSPAGALASSGPEHPGVNLILRDSYLPEVPVLVRVEFRDNAGAIAMDRWDAVATLSVDNPDVQFSPDHVHLYNGLGSALVMFTGRGDFTLTADIDGAKTAASLIDWSSRPVQSVSGSLDSSATWSGVYHVTGGDFTIRAGATLTLEPGTMVLLDGAKSGTDGTDVQIEGSIQAMGTTDSPITFTALVAGENWGELRFVDAEPSVFTYTAITQAGRSPRVGHSNSGPAVRAQGSQIVFDHVSFTDNAGKVMHTTSGCDLVFRHCLLARSIMGPEIQGTGLLFEDGWITEMHANDDADAIYIHGQQAGQECILSRGVMADMYDDGIDTLGSRITVQDFIIRDCYDKGVSIYDGRTTLDHCLIVENNAAPEDPTIATIAAKTTEGSTTIVNIHRTTIVASRYAGYADVGIQSHNKYGVQTGTVLYHVTDSIIDATDAVDVQPPYLDSDIHIDHSDVTSEAWPGAGNLQADPLFVDVQNHDYRLRPGSPCIGKASDGGDLGYHDADVPTPIQGSLTKDTVWTARGGPYLIAGEFTVPAGVSLTVEPGTSVYFESAARMVIHGRLVAEGSEDLPIRFTRTPGSQGTWTGLQFISSTADNRITYAVVEYGRTNDGMIGVEKSRLLLEHVTFDHTDLRRVRVSASWLTVRRCTFLDIFGPEEAPTTDNMSEHIWGSVVDDGELIVESCVFGTTKGHNDAVDVDGPARPKPPLQILNNRFLGGGDDALDLEGDAHVEGNTFTNFRKDRYNTAARESNVISAGRGRYYVVVRNVFYNCGHVAQIKDSSFMTFASNAVMGVTDSAFFFQIPELGGTPGEGVDVDSCIFHNAPVLFDDFFIDDPKYGTTHMTVNHSIVAAPWLGFGEGNIDADPLFVAAPTDFHLKGMSPAIGAGANGLDMGACVPAGASIHSDFGEITWRTSVTLTVWGPGITHYTYSLNDPNGPWSAERSIDQPIELTDLVDGESYQVYVLGKNSAGVWQTTPNASRPWRVDTSYNRLVINEVLAWNVSAVEHDGTRPGMIELYYDGPAPLDLFGMRLTDGASPPAEFTFPQGTRIEPEQYLVLYADTISGGDGIHLGFDLDEQGGRLLLFHAGRVIDAVQYDLQLPDLSIGRVGAFGEWHLTIPTFAAPNVAHPVGDPAAIRINEWLAVGDTPFTNGFIELFNPQSAPVDMGVLHLTDSSATRNMCKMFASLTFLQDHGFVVLATNRGDLSMNGGMIILYDPKLLEVDKIIYGPQRAGISQGRSPDGSDNIEFFDVPTPGAANPVTAPVDKTLIAIDSVWSYEQGGTALDASWCQPAYVDSAWPTGPGVLYVETSTLPGPKNTSLQIGQITYYFRTHFSLDAAPGKVTSFAVTLLIDDGAIIYLNGQEVYRLGMSAGAVTSDTYASRTVGNAVLEGPFEIPTDALHQGDNVLAVEVHQVSSTSSDIVMGLQLDATIGGIPAKP